jgi:Lrp/AsnC family transcriptional regulator, leucine-responsive regulatory protein
MIDAIDTDILRILQENANATTKEISLKLHLTTTPIHERIKRLEKDGYIKKYVAILDKAKLNKGLTVFCNISLRQHTSEIGNEFVAEIGLLEEVVECYNISGDYDFLLKVLVADMPGYQQFVMNRLGSLKSIGSVKSIFVMGEIKNTLALPI